MKIISKSILAIMLGIFIAAGLPAFAQTPDGETPSNEGVCNILKEDGVTKGLYGLCVAFCEAQDIASISDPITDEELAAIENGTPSGRILANYNKKKTETDIAMPCITVEEPCPCFNSAEAAAIDGIALNGDGIQLNCNTNGDIRSSIINEGSFRSGGITAGSFLDQNPNSQEFNRGFCFYSNTQVDPRIGRSADTGFHSPRDATMTPEQAASCVAIVNAACDAAGL